MRYLLLITLMVFSFAACSKEKTKEITSSKTKVVATVKEAKTEAPCDSKEDLLKKIAKKEKAESEKGHGFSLQGGDTGCSVK